MDGKELISQSDLQSFYQQQQQHRAFGSGGGQHSPSSLAGMHSVIRPMPNMPNMNMSPTAILNSIGGGSLAGMQFQMDPPPPPPPLLHTATAAMGGSASGPGAVPPASAEPVKRKRGRPRKYGPDGSLIRPLNATPISASAPMPTAVAPGQYTPASAVGAAMKRGRGRPLDFAAAAAAAKQHQQQHHNQHHQLHHHQHQQQQQFGFHFNSIGTSTSKSLARIAFISPLFFSSY